MSVKILCQHIGAYLIPITQLGRTFQATEQHNEKEKGWTKFFPLPLRKFNDLNIQTYRFPDKPAYCVPEPILDSTEANPDSIVPNKSQYPNKIFQQDVSSLLSLVSLIFSDIYVNKFEIYTKVVSELERVNLVSKSDSLIHSMPYNKKLYILGIHSHKLPNDHKQVI